VGTPVKWKSYNRHGLSGDLLENPAEIIDRDIRGFSKFIDRYFFRIVRAGYTAKPYRIALDR
jgi:hypothetical protein